MVNSLFIIVFIIKQKYDIFWDFRHGLTEIINYYSGNDVWIAFRMHANGSHVRVGAVGVRLIVMGI